MSRRIAVVGAGAVGGYVGGHLTRRGEDVTLIDAWPEHVVTMKEKGIDLSGMTEAECVTVPVRALHINEVECLSREAPVDIAFVCTKSYDTEWATTLIREYLAPEGFVVSLQNSINEDRIAGVVGEDRTIGCIASMISVDLYEPGRVRRTAPMGGDKHTVFRVGEMHGRPSQRIDEVAEMLRVVDSSKSTTNLKGERWSKLVLNSMRNALSASTGLSGNEGDARTDTRRLAIRLAGEAVRVGQALGYELEQTYKMAPEQLALAAEGDAVALATVEEVLLAASGRRSSEQRPSMAQDVRKGRRTEIEFLNGLVGARGREVGIPTPANDGMVEVMRRVERGELTQSPENVAGL